jgi:CheY-like chemotaxis protein
MLMQEPPARVLVMDIRCPRCGGPADPAGHEDARAFFQCPSCNRVWATRISASRHDGSPAGAPPPRVLVAEDSPEMIGLLSAWLEDEGCIVIPAMSGREAIEAAAACRPQAAIIDVVLPPPDGFQVCEALARQPRPPAVVLMTGMSHVDRQRVSELGALLMLQKPFTREMLLDALSLAFEQYRRAEAAAGEGVSGAAEC